MNLYQLLCLSVHSQSDFIFTPHSPATSPQVILKQRTIFVKIWAFKQLTVALVLKKSFYLALLDLVFTLSWLLLFIFIASSSKHRSHAGNVNLSDRRNPRHWKRNRRTPLRYHDVAGWCRFICCPRRSMGQVGIPEFSCPMSVRTLPQSDRFHFWVSCRHIQGGGCNF